MEFEDILKDIGDFGFYQKLLTIVFLVPAFMVIPWISLNVIFVTSSPDHWCHVPEVESWNLSIEKQKYLIRPSTDPSCSRYDVNYTQILQSGKNWTVDLNWPTKKCDMGWQYDTTDYEETATTKWNLVCGDEHYQSLIVSLVFVGVALCNPAYGFIADKWGRKPTFLFLASLVAVCELVSAFSPSLILFLLMRVCIGSTMSSMYTIAYIMVLELVRPDVRSRINAIVVNCWTVGTSLLSLIAYLTRSYVYLSIVVSVAAACLLLYGRILPESPSWLISQEKYEEAAEILKKISKMNGRTPPDNLLYNIQNLGKKQKESSIEKSSPLDFIKYPNMRKRCFIIIIGWMGVCIPYYGVQVNVTNLYGNQFMNFFLMSLVEFPAKLITWWVLVKIGGKKTSQLGFLVSSLSCLVPFIAPPGYSSVGIVVSLILKAGSSSGFMSQYQLSPELFPTSHRGMGMGMSMTVGVGSTLVVPYIVQLEKYGANVPLLVFSLIAFFAFVCTSFLPETHHQNLPQSVSDVENCAQNKNCCQCGWNETYEVEARKLSCVDGHIDTINLSEKLSSLPGKLSDYPSTISQHFVQNMMTKHTSTSVS